MNSLGRLAPVALVSVILAAACGQQPVAAPAAGAVTSASSAPPAAAQSASPAPASAAARSGGVTAAASVKPEATGQFSGGDPNGSPLRVSYASPAVSNTPYYAALAHGFFQQQHIKITQIMMPPNVAVSALSKGEIDIVDSPGNAIEGAVRGLPFKVIFAAWQQSPWTLVGKQQFNSVAGLKGKTIGTNQAGSTPYLYLEAALKKAGLAKSDVKIVSSGGTVISYQNLIAGTVDAAVLSPPFDSQAELNGFHEIQFLGDLLELPYIGAGSSVPFLTAHHDETVRFLRALIDANHWIRAHPDETADLIVRYIGVPREVAVRSTEKMIPKLAQDKFEASATGLGQALDIQAALTGKKIDLQPDQLVDYGPLREALKA